MPDANRLINAQLDVEVNAGAVALVWSAAPLSEARIVTLTAILGTLQNGVLHSQFCAAECSVPGTRGVLRAGTDARDGGDPHRTGGRPGRRNVLLHSAIHALRPAGSHA